MSDQPTTLATLDRLAVSRDFAGLRDTAHAAAIAFPEAWQPPYHEARALLELGEDAPAEALLTQTRARFPHLHQVAVLYAYAGARLLDPAAALDRWRALTEELPAAPGLAIGYAQALVAAGRPADAEQAIAGALRPLPDCVPILVQYASLAADRHDWPAASERWQAVLALQPTRLDALIGAISAQRELGAHAEAELLADRALATHPDDPDLNTTCAALATARGDWGAAIDRLTRAVAARPADAALSLALAGAYQRTGRIGDAEAVLKAGLALVPDDLAMLRAYAELASRANKWEEAEERWADAYERCPPNIAIYQSYAEALNGIEEFDDAERILAEGVGFAPTAKALLIGYAQAASRRFDWTEAAVRWGALRKAFPEDEGVRELINAARKDQTQKLKKEFHDQKAISRKRTRGALGEEMRTNPGPPRDPIFGPTALDLLIASKVEAPPPPPPKPSRFAGLRRMFGGR